MATAPAVRVEAGRDHFEQQYLDLMRQIWSEGDERRDRTGVGTRSLFGATMRFDLSDGRMPLVTPKRVYWKTATREMLWFLTLVFGGAGLLLALIEAAAGRLAGAGRLLPYAAGAGALAAAPTSADAANTSVLLFGAGRLNDTSLFSDYSLAGIRFSLLRNGELVDTSTGGPTGAVPLPASAVFLLAGLVGFGTLRLRSRRS